MFKIKLFHNNEEVDSVDLSVGKVVSKSADFKPILNDTEKNYLNQQLESYKQLVQLEPDNKCKFKLFQCFQKWKYFNITIFRGVVGNEFN